ncbi:SubName: Full=Related to 2`-O-ribosyl phosphate transferase RIT1 {ECO:0000313/EMBL:CCA68512.1} [Serendipita indica DSM 11827]|nr:SubName: Full=Related to 2`-O-ribosyl phosphate transferase RIT1 {ECO:0000313/EMBL:CCA68512.1} [Serendipita indica DSM 11827]
MPVSFRLNLNLISIAVKASSFILPPLDKPLRPFWISPRSSVLPSFGQDPEFYPVICISASKVISDGLERRQAGYTYIQGSGDDHESWSMGLTPPIYWERKRELLAVTQDDLPNTVKQIVLEESDKIMVLHENIFYIDAVGGQIAYWCGRTEPQGVSIIIRSGESTSIQRQETSLVITAANGKRKPLDLLHLVLPAVDSFGRKWLDDSGHRVIIVDQDARYDEGIGILMLLLGSFFDDDGREVQAMSNPV